MNKFVFKRNRNSKTRQFSRKAAKFAKGKIMKKWLEKDKTPEKRDQKSVAAYYGGILKDLYPLSGREVLNQILDMNRPQKLIRGLPAQDFFWLVKKVGDNDCLPLLEMASYDQWQYLLDLELWKRDRLNPDKTFSWLARLQMSDPRRLVKWLFSQGQALTYLFLFKNIRVETGDEDGDYDPEEGFFSFDGTFYVKVTNKEYREVITGILRTMAEEDLVRCQAILSGLAGVLPAEMEEEMQRMRSARLAEHGFLPFEEALSVYAPPDHGSIDIEEQTELVHIPLDEETLAMVPLSPLYHAGTGTMLTGTLSGIKDPLLLDKIRLEFAGLCNQILSADGTGADELEALVKTCQKAGAYLNLALERFCGADIALAGKLLRNNSLVSIFRAGFGLALELKWEAQRWQKGGWFHEKSLDFGFWGNEWGETLEALMAKRPRLWVGFKGGEERKDFERLSELDACRKLLKRLMVLDRLLARLTEHYLLDEKEYEEPGRTFHPLLFNLWARDLLKLAPCFSGIGPDHVKGLFSLLRVGERSQPFRMSGFEEVFVKYFLGYASDFEPETQGTLRDTLTLIWNEFRDEYEWVSADHLDGRFSRYIRITS